MVSLLYIVALTVENYLALDTRINARYINYNIDIPLYIITIVIVNLLVMTTYNLSMYFIYVNKIPFFEQFRTNKVQRR